MYAINLKTNHLTNPIGIDADGLFLSWTCAGGIRQTAYRIRMLQADETVWDSGIVKSDEMHVQCLLQIASRTRIDWTVQLWDENGETQEPAEAAYFETGLNAEDWQAKWVAPELSLLTAEDCGCRDAINAFAKKQFEEKQAQKEEAQREEYIPHQPASYLRKVFSAEAPERPAHLYITARGLYEASLNGQRVGDMVLAPGAWTADQHLGVQTYDVTDLIKEGDNVLDPADLETARFTAHAVYSDMSETGQFRCSDEDVNQLVRNSLWSMKSNSFRPALRGGGTGVALCREEERCEHLGDLGRHRCTGAAA